MDTQKLLLDELKRLGTSTGYLFTSHQLLTFKNTLTPPQNDELPIVIRELCNTGFFEERNGYRLTEKGYFILWNS